MTPPGRLRVTIVGAGVIGCYLGGRLARHAEVTLYGRPSFLDHIAEHGLTVEGDGKSNHIEPTDLALSYTPDAVREADVVLVCTKSVVTAEATAEIRPHLPDHAVVIGMQNGLHSADTIRDGLSKQLVLPGMIPFNVVRVGDYRFRRASAGTILVGRHSSVERFVTVARDAGIVIQTVHDMQAVLHGKLLLNLNNAIQALADQPLREELLDRDFRRCLAMCQREALRVFSAAGVIPKLPLPSPAGLLPYVLRLPTPIFRRVSQATLQVDPIGRSSTGDDLDRGRRTEIDDLQGEVVRMGQRLGVTTPVCARVVELVKEAEAAGADRRRWASQDLLAELRSV